MNESHKRKLLKVKLVNYVSAFVEDLNRVHQDTKAKFKTEDEEYLIDDYLYTFTEDINDIKKAYEAKDDGETLDRLWNGSYNYNMEDD